VPTNQPSATISHVYSVAMAWISIQLKTSKETLRIAITKVEDNDETNELVLKDDKGNITGKFNKNEVAGWWMS
jgi:hypothetical protein